MTTRCRGCGRPLAGAIDPARLAIDAAVAVGLVLALAVVFALDKKAPSSGGLTSETSEGKSAEGGGVPLEARPLRLGVTLPEHDDMGTLLGTLGSGYRYRTIPFDDLLDAERLAENDVVFLTCGGVPGEWLGRKLRPSDRDPSGGVYAARPEITARLKEALREFVRRGGTLYASDFRYQLLKVAFPEYVDRSLEARGEVQTVQADVVDRGLQKQLGPVIRPRFDKRGWYPAALQGPEVTTYLRGKYRTIDGAETTGPLLVKFPFGEGTVVFTSFHNEAQNTEMELELLRYLVFTTVTAREEVSVRRTMVRGGFSPKERNLLSVSSGSEPASETYECREAGALQFVLGFEDQGARLRLTVVGPDGTRHEKTGTKTFQIDVPDAAAGRWQYMITPLEVPYKNFPFTLTIGEKR